jgi:hypothetical protein
MGVLERLLPRRFTLQLVLVVAGSMLVSQALYTDHVADEQGDVIEEVLRTQAQALAANIAANATAALIGNDLDLLEQLLMQSVKFPGVRSLQIVDPAGRALADVFAVANGRPQLRFGSRFPPPAADSALSMAAIDGGSTLLVWHPIHERTIGWVRIGTVRDDLQYRRGPAVSAPARGRPAAGGRIRGGSRQLQWRATGDAVCRQRSTGIGPGAQSGIDDPRRGAARGRP